MIIKKKQRDQSGSTIIEVLIATVVVAMVMTAVASVLSVSLNTTTQFRYRAVATSQAQSGLEIFRREKNLLGWQSFYTAVDPGIYCMNTLPTTSAAFVALSTGSGCGSARVEFLGNDFEREAYVTKTGTEIRVEMVVSWVDGVRPQEVRLTQLFKQFN